MATAASPLALVLENLNRLRPEEIKIVKKRLSRPNGAPRISSAPKTLLEDKRFMIPLEEYLSLSDDARDEIQLLAYKNYREWLYQQLAQLHARWMLICGGKIIDSSPILNDYPSDQRMMTVGKKMGFAPLVFISNTLIEESSWTALFHDDFYPNVSIIIGGSRWSKKKLLLQGLQLDADFDTGASDILLDYSQLLGKDIISLEPFKPAQENYHLGRNYQFYLRPVKVAAVNETGIIASKPILALCVRNWPRSPLCLVNPFRKALAGRNLLLELPLRVELDGRKRRTKILAEA